MELQSENESIADVTLYQGWCSGTLRRHFPQNQIEQSWCKSTVWLCVSRVEKDDPDCLARTVHEEMLQEVVIKAINEAIIPFC